MQLSNDQDGAAAAAAVVVMTGPVAVVMTGLIAARHCDHCYRVRLSVCLSPLLTAVSALQLNKHLTHEMLT